MAATAASSWPRCDQRPAAARQGGEPRGRTGPAGSSSRSIRSSLRRGVGEGRGDGREQAAASAASASAAAIVAADSPRSATSSARTRAPESAVDEPGRDRLAGQRLGRGVERDTRAGRRSATARKRRVGSSRNDAGCSTRISAGGEVGAPAERVEHLAELRAR